MTQNQKIETIVSELNEALENDAMYWKDELQCEPEEIVDKFGFGWDQKKTIRYLPDLDEVKTPVNELYKTVQKCKGDVLKMRELIESIFDNN